LTRRPAVKFCGLTRQEDASLAESLGAGFTGFVLHPGSPRHISARAVSGIRTNGPKRVGVFVNQKGPEILELMEEGRLDMAQLHGAQDERDAEIIGGSRVIRVLWPERHGSLEGFREEALRWAGLSALLLLDSGAGGGGHGRRIEGSALRFIRESPAPYILAGGLGPDALEGLWPSGDGMLLGFDLNSGVESAPGIKDRALMERAAAALGMG
jgi:phosphoribosylanthranilate isomerase